jgi:hypothetical protein
MVDVYQVRNDILGQLRRYAISWLELALGRAPMELQSTLQVRASLLSIDNSDIITEIPCHKPAFQWNSNSRNGRIPRGTIWQGDWSRSAPSGYAIQSNIVVYYSYFRSSLSRFTFHMASRWCEDACWTNWREELLCWRSSRDPPVNLLV